MFRKSTSGILKCNERNVNTIIDFGIYNVIIEMWVLYVEYLDITNHLQQWTQMTHGYDYFDALYLKIRLCNSSQVLKHRVTYNLTFVCYIGEIKLELVR